ncbi:MAG TPA: hypothetical protein VMP41_10795 [Acidimicrobiales bacterium]|nr:hypothetical protein [Acidimicrobiales bacterium]
MLHQLDPGGSGGITRLERPYVVTRRLEQTGNELDPDHPSETCLGSQEEGRSLAAPQVDETERGAVNGELMQHRCKVLGIGAHVPLVLVALVRDIGTASGDPEFPVEPVQVDRS